MGVSSGRGIGVSDEEILARKWLVYVERMEIH